MHSFPLALRRTVRFARCLRPVPAALGATLALWCAAASAQPQRSGEPGTAQDVPMSARVELPGVDLPGVDLPGVDLPDAPSVVAENASSSSSLAVNDGSASDPQSDSASKAPGQPGSRLPRFSAHSDTVVAAGQIAPPQSARNKIVGSLKDSISPFAVAGNVISAGYSHLTDGSPNYGTDGNAFAQRFGAAMARGSSQSIFSNGVMASVLHQDPRYYQLGPKYSILHRGVYAATRPLISRTDSGRKTPNIALLSGYLGAAFLTRTYYPDKNQSISENFQTYGSSIGGAAIGFAVSEFLPQVLQAVHLNKID